MLCVFHSNKFYVTKNASFMLLIGTFQAAALLNVAQANLKDAFKSLNHGKQTKWNQLAKKWQFAGVA